jgi:GntR family transcriptional regulator
MEKLKKKKQSLSLQAQQYLHRLIEDGTYQPGEQLPSEADLAEQLGISRPTLREALRHLEQERMIVRRHGVGTFVAPGYEQRLEGGLEKLESILDLAGRQGMQIHFTELEVNQESADAELAEKLEIPPKTALTCVSRVLVADQTPVAYMVDAVLASVLKPVDVTDTFTGSVLDLLKQRYDRPLAHALVDIVALSASASLARQLGIKPGRAVLLMEETLYDEEGTAVDFSRNYFVPDFFRFHLVRR